MLVSVIIPCFNVEDYVKECVSSAFFQTLKNIEVICIDNNSTDNTWIKLKELKKIYPSLIIAEEKKPGAPAARNKGLSLAKGEWIQFLDADDLILNLKLEHQINLVRKNYEAPFIAGAYIKRNILGADRINIPNLKDTLKGLFFSKLGITSSNLWNSKYVTQADGWDESLNSSQEADLMFRILKLNSNIIYDTEPLTIVRERSSGQISQTNLDQKWKRYFLKRVEMMEWMKISKKEYFKSQEQVFLDGLFGIIKILASEDLMLAVEMYDKYLGTKFRPASEQKHSKSYYLILLKLFGFEKTEKIRKFLG